MKSGFLLVDKPKGWTSFDVCAKLRGIVGTKRIGHTGTLDPFATGLLIIAVGKATKMIPFLEKDKKTYEAKVRFGVTSETLDPESEVVAIEGGKERMIEEADIKTVLSEKFAGKIQQVPPKYSALKVNGKKMYELAREGKEIEIKSREAEIFETKIIDHESPYLDIEITAAAGFYVRSFARDLAQALGSDGICWELRRTKVGDLRVSDNRWEVKNEEDLQTGEKDSFSLIDPKEILKIPQIEIEKERLDDFCGGRAFDVAQGDQERLKDKKVLVLSENESVGIGEILHGKLQPRIVLLECK